MGTEIAISFSTLRAQLENEKTNLYKIDENIKRIVQTTGRFQNDRFNSGEYQRGGPRQGRNPFPDSGNYKTDDQFNKRKHETKTVFSRLSARVNDSDGEDDIPGSKRVRVPSAVCRELPTRAAVLRAQGDDEQARTRNRRIFGSLLGTLQKFKQEEIVLQTKEDKKAQVERKIEEQARQEKEREQKERKTLFAEREHKKTTIKALEAKLGRVQEFEKWEETQKNLSNFILTKVKPSIYWIPKKMNEKAAEKLSASQKFQDKYLIKKRELLQEELHRIEQRCLRPRAPGTKENDPDSHEDKHIHADNHHDLHIDIKEEDKARKRDKFAMDVDEVNDSDGDDRHDDGDDGHDDGDDGHDAGGDRHDDGAGGEQDKSGAEVKETEGNNMDTNADRDNKTVEIEETKTNTEDTSIKKENSAIIEPVNNEEIAVVPSEHS